MTRHQKITLLLTVLAIVITVPGAFVLGLSRIHVDADIVSSIPRGDAVIDNAAKILGRHPALDMVTMDIHMAREDGQDCADPQRLVEAASFVEERLEKSDLFDHVGMEHAARAMTELFQVLLDHLPQLFDSEQLRLKVAQRIRPQAIDRALREQMKKLSGLQGVGQAKAIAKDPLGLRDLVLGRMAALNPAQGAHLYKGKLISSNACHLLVLADPKRPGSDTMQARKIVALLDEIQEQLPRHLQPGKKVEITSIGAFRSALDNETIARADTKRAIWIATLGVALLLLLCFPRPWLGLLALVPAVAGVSFALLVYSLIESSISALALGFGGALVTISVDHAIAYLQILDRPQISTGRQASREVWSVGLVAALTTVGAFLTLYLSGITMLGEVGLFAALGVGLSFVFVHTVFPLLFPRVNSSQRKSLLPVADILGKLTGGKSWLPVLIAAALAIAMLMVGVPEFRADLQSMNTVSKQTLEAEKLVKETWGDVYKRTYLLSEQASMAKLRQSMDHLSDFIKKAEASDHIRSGFSPSMLLPGEELAKRNTEAWKKFFDKDRIEQVSTELRKVGDGLGFSSGAFEPFIASITHPNFAPVPLPEDLHAMLGITHTKDNGWIWVGAIEAGAQYDPESIYRHAQEAGFSVFDPVLFSHHMSRLLGYSFTKMLLIVAAAVFVLLVILFLDATLVLITLIPLGFALVCTMGLMKIFGHPMDIPSLMLGVVVLGMGVDYALYFVKAQQRYFISQSPAMAPIRVAVFLAAASTMVGLGTLALAKHAVPHSAGFTTLLGIGFSLLGAFAILPPFLRRLFAPRPFLAVQAPGSASHRRAVLKRFAHLEPSVRMFARFKLMLDPMFPYLARLVGSLEDKSRVIDIGCGYGVPSCYLAAVMQKASFYLVEPDEARARIAERAMGDKAEVEKASATSWNLAAGPFDLALLLDVVHYMTDEELKKALCMIRDSLGPGGNLIIRADIPASGRFAWERWMEATRLRAKGLKPVFRSESNLKMALEESGFFVDKIEPCAPNREETWFEARPSKDDRQ